LIGRDYAFVKADAVVDVIVDPSTSLFALVAHVHGRVLLRFKVTVCDWGTRQSISISVIVSVYFCTWEMFQFVAGLTSDTVDNGGRAATDQVSKKGTGRIDLAIFNLMGGVEIHALHGQMRSCGIRVLRIVKGFFHSMIVNSCHWCQIIRARVVVQDMLKSANWRRIICVVHIEIGIGLIAKSCVLLIKMLRCSRGALYNREVSGSVQGELFELGNIPEFASRAHIF
jgi:hypothetical protein